MKHFVAKNAKQLSTCLKMLYSERIGFSVDIQFANKDKIIYLVMVDVDDKTMEQLEFKYKVLIG